MCRLSSYSLAPNLPTPRYLDQYLTRLHDPNVAVRRGYALALGSLPLQLLRPVRDEVRHLQSCMLRNADVGATHMVGAAAWAICASQPDPVHHQCRRCMAPRETFAA